MPRPTGNRNVSDSVRHAATLDVLSGVHPDRVAEEHGITRRTVYKYGEIARKEGAERREMARSELEFWEDVCERLGY